MMLLMLIAISIIIATVYMLISNLYIKKLCRKSISLLSKRKEFLSNFYIVLILIILVELIIGILSNEPLIGYLGLITLLAILFISMLIDCHNVAIKKLTQNK